MAELTVIDTRNERPHPEPTGRALLDGSQCLCGDEVRADDLVLANFDKREVHTGGALYLLQSSNGWRGCRRMMRTMGGIAIDQNGGGDWVTVPSMDATAWRVVGTVETVYRPTRYDQHPEHAKPWFSTEKGRSEARPQNLHELSTCLCRDVC